MGYIAGSQDWLRENGYRVVRTGPAKFVVLDDECGGGFVCAAKTHADAVRELINLRFSETSK